MVLTPFEATKVFYTLLYEGANNML